MPDVVRRGFKTQDFELFLYGFKQGIRSLLSFFFPPFEDVSVIIGQIVYCFLPQRGKQGDISVLPQFAVELFYLFPMGGQFNSLFSFPGSLVGSDLFLLMVERKRRLVCLEGDMPADGPGRRRVAVIIKAAGKVLMHQKRCGFPIVGQQ